MDPAAAIVNYRQLLAKIDAKVDAITYEHRREMQCRRGCHSCCKPGLTVSGVERENIRKYLLAHPESQTALASLAEQNPFAGERCALLAADGSCTIYPVRPVVCRSHGVPLRVSLDSQKREQKLDSCPLNFVGQALETLPAADVIDLDTLNTLLALINQQFAGDTAAQRSALTLKGLLDP